MHRASGVLLHPSSLPGPYGIGDMGMSAYTFVDWLQEAGQSLWQVLPLGPTGYGDSPYAAFSTFAGNPLLIGFDPLLASGYLSASDIVERPKVDDVSVDFGSIIPWKRSIVLLAADRFLDGASATDRGAYRDFKIEEAWWLDDYALFMDIKETEDARARKEGRSGAMWANFWPAELALRSGSAMAEWKSTHERSIEKRKVEQFFFFSQWLKLKSYANDRGISIIGDLPIFVAADSVDVWANRELFQLDDSGAPIAVAGVPPDYFSATGQLWGNPLYDWNRHQNDNFAWWIRRMRGNLRLFDWLRIDHFRGFESYWSVPFGKPDAVEGKWEKAPGHAFFAALKSELGDLPILAEDLGFITDEVRSLRDAFNLPGMKILQFAFDAAESGKGLNAENAFLPHMYTNNCVVYTGTHDNDTLRGWLEKATPAERAFIESYLGHPAKDMVAELIRLAFASVANLAVVPMQDVLGLGSRARMNIPSTVGGNWMWRARADQFESRTARFLKETAFTYARNLHLLS